jgi:hypothetical protein
MKRLYVALFALALVLGSGAQAWASPVTWSYNFTPSQNFLLGDTGTNQIDFTNQGAVTTTGSTDVAGTNLAVHNALSDTFTGKEYILAMAITDGANMGTLNFKGLMNGTITAGNPSLTNTFETPVTQTLTLGSDTFTVTANSFTSPNPFGASVKGAIGFHVDVNGGSTGTPPPPPPPPPNPVPEPSTMLLSVLGLAGLGFKAWRKVAVA